MQEPPAAGDKSASGPAAWATGPQQRVLPLGFGLAEELGDPREPRRPASCALAPRGGDRRPAPAASEAPIRALQEIQEVIAQRLGHVSRRLEEIHQAADLRVAEQRKETWVLLIGLSIVLLFCFAAFFMNQIEVHDLHSGLQSDLERRSEETVESIQKAVAELYGKNLPKLQAAMEKTLKEKDQRDHSALGKILTELESQGSKNEAQVEESQKLLEDCLERMERLVRELHTLQAMGGKHGLPPGLLGMDSAGRETPAAAGQPAVAVSAAPAHLLPEVLPPKVLPPGAQKP